MIKPKSNRLDASSCRQIRDNPQIGRNGKAPGCRVNYWGDFAGDAFADVLLDAINHRKIVYAGEML